MKLFIDDANVKEISRLTELYPIDGVTTNPTILARAGGDPVGVLREIRRTIGDGLLLFVQVIPADTEGMVRDARAIRSLLGENTVAKIPAVPEGIRAIRILKEEGIMTCGTAVFTPMQAYMAAKAGADYVAPYVNRIDEMGYDGFDVVCRIQDIFTQHAFDTVVLAASFKNTQQVLDLCAGGVGAATCAPAVLDGFMKNFAAQQAVVDFARDFAAAVGPGKTMADLIGAAGDCV